MLEKLTLAACTEALNTSFRVRLDAEHTLELVLAKVTPGRSTQWQEQFSIEFKGPLELFLPQRLFPMEHETLGAFEIFLVPVGQDPDGFRYEAVFNRLVKQA